MNVTTRRVRDLLCDRLGKRSVVLFILALLSVLAFEEVADDVFRDIPEGDLEARHLDESVARWFTALRSERMTQAMTDLTALGSVSVLGVVAFAAAALLLMSGHRRALAQLAITGAGALFIPPLLKQIFDRARPDVAGQLVAVNDLSFPSGHSFAAAAIYLFLLLYGLTRLPHPLYRAFWVLFTMLIIGLVGVSRIYLGVHHATDVLGGLAAGAAWSLIVALAFEARRDP